MIRSNFLDYLEAACELFPDKTAFADFNESVTFSQLRELGKKVGSYLALKVPAACLPVAVLTTHSVADVVAFIGVMYAGCFYVPMDGLAPKSHTDARLEVICPAAVISAKTISQLPVADINSHKLSEIRSHMKSSDPVYAIFTSGSTGVPKAAVIAQRSVINLIEWMCDTLDFNENSVFAGQPPFYFDSSVQELYSTLKCGATTYLFPKKYFISPLKVLKLVDEVGANVMPWAAAAIKLVANSGAFEKYTPTGVSDVVFGGENMPAKILNIWRKAMPNTRFTNVYGPTETTVDCAYYTVDRDLPDEISVPIGYPVRNTELFLLDSNGRPVPKNEAGELYVGGIHVGLGYYNDPERTAESFIKNPNSQLGETIYKTGDIVRENEYGELVFLARADDQVKHMGSRVELGEVESVAASVEGIRLVFCSYDKENSKILMFYEGQISASDLTSELNKRLPKYMCPNEVINVEKMPEMPNGKIDRLTTRRVYYDNSR